MESVIWVICQGDACGEWGSRSKSGKRSDCDAGLMTKKGERMRQDWARRTLDLTVVQRQLQSGWCRVQSKGCPPGRPHVRPGQPHSTIQSLAERSLGRIWPQDGGEWGPESSRGTTAGGCPFPMPLTTSSFERESWKMYLRSCLTKKYKPIKLAIRRGSVFNVCITMKYHKYIGLLNYTWAYQLWHPRASHWCSWWRRNEMRIICLGQVIVF